MSNTATNSELLAKASSGDRVAMHQLLLAHYDPLIKHITAKIPPRFQSGVGAEDVIQQTFLQVMHHIGRFSPQHDQSFHAWLTTIANNRLTDIMRHLGVSAHQGRDVVGLDAGGSGLDSALVRWSQASVTNAS